MLVVQCDAGTPSNDANHRFPHTAHNYIFFATADAAGARTAKQARHAISALLSHALPPCRRRVLLMPGVTVLVRFLFVCVCGGGTFDHDRVNVPCRGRVLLTPGVTVLVRCEERSLQICAMPSIADNYTAYLPSK